jgi:UDPglucose 6-dehydrogenase
MKLGIVGNGFVGQASKALASSQVSLVVYDRDPQKCEPLGTTWEEVSSCEVVMISVPTPMGHDESCSVRIVDSVIEDLRTRGNPRIIIRSTVPVGFCESRRVFFMPEFLTEAHWDDDFRSTPVWVIGTDTKDDVFEKTLQFIFSAAKYDGNIRSNTLHFMTTKEAEAVKYFRNCFLATKVSFCNEFHDFCVAHGMHYENVVDVAASDKRIDLSHTKVPGPDGRRGFGGTCFPKDMSSMVYQFSQLKVPSPVLSAAVTRNLQLDRPERDWEADVGRAVETNDTCGGV